MQDIIAQGSAAQYDIPADKPLGQLNLRWPPSVPYVRWEDSREGVTPMSRPETATMVNNNDTQEDFAAGPYGRPNSHVYDKLGSREFRLIYLPAAKDQDSLIHLEMETFSFDDSPEYETTSYAWGGEDGDDSICCPIYVGEYYDVLLQTKNCQSMLQYLRPHRGVRVVWIDAICINQQDSREREVQVAQMRTIYQSCQRVVVYLGPTMVHNCNKRFRSRHWLHEFGSSTFRQILTHRYFSRLWVIQELLLSPSLLVPLYDSDFLADSTFSKRIDVSWNETAAPWFQHVVSRKTFPRRQLLTVLRQTWSSKAMDPRDKVFGILGLVDTRSDTTGKAANGLVIEDCSLIPDYSLSALETFIGVTAYIIITFGHWKFLENAVGMNALPGYPRWTPDYHDPLIWHNKSAPEDSDFDHLNKWYYSQRLCCSKSWSLSTSDKIVYQRSSLGVVRKRNGWRKHGANIEQRANMRYEDSVRDGFSINSSTAALSIKLVRILYLTSGPSRVATLGSLHVFKFSQASYSIIICTGPVPLDVLLGTEPVWLFLRETDLRETDNEDYHIYQKAGSTLFFLRDSQRGRQGDTYDLVSCCVCWDLVICQETKRTSSGKDSDDYPSTYDSHMQKVHTSNTSLWTHPLLYEPLQNDITQVLARFPSYSKTLELGIWRTFPSKDPWVWKVLPVLQYLLDSVGKETRALSAAELHQFKQIYLSTLRQTSTDFSPSLISPCEWDHWVHLPPGNNEDCIFLTPPPSEWKRIYKPSNIKHQLWEISTGYEKIWVNSRTASTEELDDKGKRNQESYHDGWVGWQRMTELQWTNPNPDNATIPSYALIHETQDVYIYMDLNDVVEALTETNLYYRLCRLTKFRPLVNENETAMIQQPKDKYRGIYWHDWPDSLTTELQLDCTPRRVQLV